MKAIIIFAVLMKIILYFIVTQLSKLLK